MRWPTETVVRQYRDSVFRAAFSICKNREDAEDIAQEVFMQYHTSGKSFASEEHLRAWLLRVAINRAKNLVRSFWHRNRMPLDETLAHIPFTREEDRGLLAAVLALPEKYRIPLHLYYYEDYAVREIGEVLRIPENTVKSRLARGRQLLKEAWREEDDDR